MQGGSDKRGTSSWEAGDRDLGTVLCTHSNPPEKETLSMFTDTFPSASFEPFRGPDKVLISDN